MGSVGTKDRQRSVYVRISKEAFFPSSPSQLSFASVSMNTWGGGGGGGGETGDEAIEHAGMHKRISNFQAVVCNY